MTILRHINWKISLFTALLLPVLVSLGLWQLGREEEKSTLQAMYEARQNALPLDLADVQALPESELPFTSVRFSGEFDNDRSFLLDNRTHEGRTGVEVITPVMTANGSVVLVNRGWLARGEFRQDLPVIETVIGTRDLRANVYVPDGKPFMLGEEEAFSRWPRVLQVLDTSRMFAELGIPADNQGLPYTLRMQEGMPGVYARYWQPVNMTPEKHRGYAIQWFSMAAALVLLFLYSITRSVKQGRRKDEQEPD